MRTTAEITEARRLVELVRRLTVVEQLEEQLRLTEEALAWCNGERGSLFGVLLDSAKKVEALQCQKVEAWVSN